ncbi:hypothetical protein Dimus_010122 [Dionaea muscipula]
MIMSLPSSCLTSSSVFEYGNYKTVVLFKGSQDDDSSSSSSPPPKPLLIGTPSEGGDFPVLLLLHGFMMKHTFYSQLIRHIASHGFIVVAPQLYTLASTDATGDINAAAAITDWLAKGSLEDLLPSNVHPMLEKVALSGHSRGGKAAFALALSKVASSALKLSALIGIDPVDGSTSGQSTPPVLTGVPDSLNLDGMPVMVIGSGLGATKKNLVTCPCAPKGVNHDNFYKECQAPAWYFLVKDYGHMDMLDDETKGITGMMTSMMCKNGKSREPMRKFVSGVLVAFLRAYLMGDDSDLIAIRDGEEVEIPVEFDAVDFRP